MSGTVTVASFVDLRTFAEGVTVTPGDYPGARTALPLPPGPVSVEAIRLAAGSGTASSAADEFVIVLAGRLTLNGLVLSPGESAVVPGNVATAWQAEAGTLALAMRCASGPAGADNIVAIDEGAELAPSGAPLAALLVGETPSCRNHTDYRSANGEFLCGTWDSTPYHRLPMRYRHYELMHLLEGTVSFRDEAGRTGTFTQGDVFLVEQGAECSWLSTTQVKKVYAIYRPAE
ncbi:cupin domain-containing protein [Sphingomonas sp.]|uniref:cupin domain-containing protein n=1 Tax=Sphingomonas sp. TaxID=28214 RepID=UPI0031D68FC4